MSVEHFRKMVEESKNNENIYVELQRLTTIVNRTKIVFGVEGNRDEEFYSQILKTKLYNNIKWEFYVFSSKNNAIKFLESNIDKDAQKLLNNKLLVILDKDYGNITLEKDLNHLKTKYQIHVTKHHSLENYYFAEKNFDLILKKQKFNEKEITKINKLLDNFIALIINYEALVVLNTLCYNIEKNTIKSDISIEAATKIKSYFYKLNEFKEISYKDIKFKSGKFEFETILLKELIKELDIIANKIVPSKIKEIKTMIEDRSVIKGKLIYNLFYEYLRKNKVRFLDLRKMTSVNHLLANDFVNKLISIGFRDFIDPVNINI